MIIYVNKNDEIVRAEITIEYIGTLKFLFIIQGNDFRFPSNDMPVSNPHRYSIGKGIDLASLNSYCDNLDIQLTNGSSKELSFKIKIDWFQGENPESIAHWPEGQDSYTGSVGAGDVYSKQLDFDYSNLN
jgi:hypothetical protein